MRLNRSRCVWGRVGEKRLVRESRGVGGMRSEVWVVGLGVEMARDGMEYGIVCSGVWIGVVVKGEMSVVKWGEEARDQ
jgi:hypothetical protein